MDLTGMFVATSFSFILMMIISYVTQKVMGFNLVKLLADLAMIFTFAPYFVHVCILTMSPPGDVEALTNFMTNYLNTFVNALPGMIVGEVVGSIAGTMKREFRRYY